MLSKMRLIQLAHSVSKLTSQNQALHSNGLRCLHTLGTTTSKCSKSLAIEPLPSNQVRLYSDDSKVTALALIKDLKHLKSSPFPALVLGLGGAIPFVAPPLYMAMTGCFAASLAFSQVAYGAAILSFVGAVRWGKALSEDGVVQPNWLNLGYSVSPALVAWVALMMPTALSLSTLMVGLCGAAYMDITMFGYPSWYKAMRFLLTMTAVLSLWTTLVFKYILSDSAIKARANVRSLKENKEKSEVNDSIKTSEQEVEVVSVPETTEAKVEEKEECK